MNGKTELHTMFILHLICYSLLAATGLSSLLWRLFKQRNWATEDQTEFLSSVLLVGQLDEIIAGQAATDKVYVDSENCFDLVSPVLFRSVMSLLSYQEL